MSQTPPGRNRFRWLKRRAIDLGDVAVQVFSVVIGILLALFINNWMAQRQQQANVDDAMRAIRAELASNRVNVRTYATHMFAAAKTMQDSPANRNLPPRPCYEWTGWNGVGGLAPLDAAYQTSIATQALANMPFRQAHLVAEIYGWQHYILKVLDLDTAILMGSPRPASYCAGVVAEVGKNVMQLDAVYARLIGPDRGPLPTPPATP